LARLRVAPPPPARRLPQAPLQRPRRDRRASRRALALALALARARAPAPVRAHARARASLQIAAGPPSASGAASDAPAAARPSARQRATTEPWHRLCPTPQARRRRPRAAAAPALPRRTTSASAPHTGQNAARPAWPRPLAASCHPPRLRHLLPMRPPRRLRRRRCATQSTPRRRPGTAIPFRQRASHGRGTATARGQGERKGGRAAEVSIPSNNSNKSNKSSSSSSSSSSRRAKAAHSKAPVG